MNTNETNLATVRPSSSSPIDGIDTLASVLDAVANKAWTAAMAKGSQEDKNNVSKLLVLVDRLVAAARTVATTLPSGTNALRTTVWQQDLDRLLEATE